MIFYWGLEVIYSDFAYLYDKLMYDVDYSKWADFIEEILKKNRLNPGLLLDLGCGTGSLTIEMSKRGYDMIGLDISEDMLSCAKEKSVGEGLNILYLNQSMTEFELYGTVDVVLCLMDSINYILEDEELYSVFRLVNNYLNPGGLFIFDINSRYKFENTLANNIFYEVGEEITYIWENNYDRNDKICEFDLTFFVKDEGCYQRHDEIHVERSFETGEILEALEKSGLVVKAMYDELSMKKPKEDSERIFFVVSKD